MKIKNISIENFRSYYGETSIEIGDRLTLIIGANGDGKTTFFEALEWLFDTSGNLPKTDSKYISKKRVKELFEGESAFVKVSLSYESYGEQKIIEKSFKFTKTGNDSITHSNYRFVMYVQNGAEKEIFEGEIANRKLDVDFAPSIRQYSLFKGEQELNIFNKPDAMSYLIETFSEIRDFDPYITFTQKAQSWSEDATAAAIRTDRKNCSEAEKYRKLIKSETQMIQTLKDQLKQKQTEAVNFSVLLDELEKNKEASMLLKSTNERLDSLHKQLSEAYSNLNENYTYRLLDDMWILLGFSPIAEEFRTLVGNLSVGKRKMENEYQQEIGAKKLANQMKAEINQGFVPLALNIPDQNTMQEMLHDEVCKVCGTPAPKGSKAYNTMKKHLDDYLASLQEAKGEQANESLFKASYIEELVSRYSVLHNNMNKISNLPRNMEKSIERNRQIHQRIDQLQSNIESQEEAKKKILAQTDGLNEDQLISAYNNISEWWKARTDAERRADFLKREIESHEDLLKDYQEKYSKISAESSAAMYGHSSDALRYIAGAFAKAKVLNKRQFLNQLENVTNDFLSQLNKGDFTGTARILERVDDSAELVLADNDNAKIYNPNTALKTSMYMSLLFAIAKLATIKHDNNFPLIFDAPTSSFTVSKERDFFGVISEIDKQTIIVTKSFLHEGPNGALSIDKQRIESLDGTIYRIKKLLPFDEKDLSTIQTTFTQIKSDR